MAVSDGEQSLLTLCLLHTVSFACEPFSYHTDIQHCAVLRSIHAEFLCKRENCFPIFRLLYFDATRSGLVYYQLMKGKRQTARSTDSMHSGMSHIQKGYTIGAPLFI